MGAWYGFMDIIPQAALMAVAFGCVYCYSDIRHRGHSISLNY
jgi:hypothetical protein